MNLRDDNLAPMDLLAALPPQACREVLAGLPEETVAQLRYIWELWARPEQLEPPDDWLYWLMLSGRGAGKTRAGAEWVRLKIESGIYSRLSLVGRTHDDVRDTMVEGESGILAVSRPDFRPQYRPRRRDLTWPNGAVAHLFSAEEPDRLRGPQCEAAWCDEIASWRYPADFDNLMLGLRLGSDPRCVITSTPRPTALMRSLVANKATVVTVSSTYANRVNLAQPFLDSILERYEGTRLGRQEIYGELLEDVPGALWHHERLDDLRVKKAPADLKQIVVAVDPAVSSSAESDETGIVVIGTDEHDHAYVLADLSAHCEPVVWARKVVEAYHRHQANLVVAETNQGGLMVRDMLRQIEPALPVKMVRARRGKYQRAEPAAALYEQGRVHHVGCHAALEDQMCVFTSDIDRRQGSPDRVDALVWGLTHLLIKNREPRMAQSIDLLGGCHAQSLGGGLTWIH